MRWSGKQHRPYWPGMFFFVATGAHVMEKGLWTEVDGIFLRVQCSTRKMLEHLMCMSLFWTNFFLHDRFETRSVFNTYIFGLKTPCQALHIWGWGCQGWPPWAAHFTGSQLTIGKGYPKSIVTSVFSASRLPTCQQGAWKLQASLCFPGPLHGLDVWDLQCKALGSLPMQLPAQKPRNQLKWDLSCYKGPGCLKKS